jgi:ATP-dependent Clp protease ATP-binding subunit ClpA
VSAKKIFQGDGNPAFVRNLEMFRAVTLLGRRIKNNAMLLGEAGVGKTAVIEGLAFAAIDQRVPSVYIS